MGLKGEEKYRNVLKVELLMQWGVIICSNFTYILYSSPTFYIIQFLPVLPLLLWAIRLDLIIIRIRCISYVKLIELYGNANLCKYHANETSVHHVELPIEYRKPGMDPLTGVNISLNIHILWHN